MGSPEEHRQLSEAEIARLVAGLRRILATDFCLAPVGQERKVTAWERRPRRDIGGCNRGEDAAPTSVFED